MNDNTYIFMLYSKYVEQCYSNFLMNNNSFVDAATVVKSSTGSKADIETFLKDTLSVTVSNMLKMAFSYQSEMFKNEFLNEALPDSKNLLNEIKTKVSAQNKTINNAQLYKLMREAFVHDNSGIPNFQVIGVDEFNLKLKPKGQPEINLKLSSSDLLRIITVFNLNIEKAMYYVSIKGIDLQNAIDNGSLTQANISNYISAKQYGEDVVFDSYQQDALVNYFYSNNDICKSRYSIGSAFGEPLMARIPFQSNPYNLYTDYMKVVYYLMYLSRHVSQNIFDIEQGFYNFNKSNNVPLKEFITINPIVDINYNIILAAFANMATTVTKTEIVEFFKNAGIQIDEQTANSLRNSCAHGRYFMNCKADTCVEFYDGRSLDSLQHFLTLKIKDIDKILTTEIFNYDKTLTESINQKNKQPLN